MPLSSGKMDMLRQLSLRPLTAIDLPTKAQINMILGLVNAGYARDFSAHKGHRIEIRLRIWGITAAGRAVLEQRSMVETTTRQPSLPLLQKTPLKIKGWGRVTPTKKLVKKTTKQSNEEK